MKVADSLFILGSNGVLTEHILTPQKATGVPDGEDAPIELCHKPELEWSLLRLEIFVLCFTDFFISENHNGPGLVLLMPRTVHL